MYCTYIVNYHFLYNFLYNFYKVVKSLWFWLNDLLKLWRMNCYRYFLSGVERICVDASQFESRHTAKGGQYVTMTAQLHNVYVCINNELNESLTKIAHQIHNSCIMTIFRTVTTRNFFWYTYQWLEWDLPIYLLNSSVTITHFSNSILGKYKS